MVKSLCFVHLGPPKYTALISASFCATIDTIGYGCFQFLGTSLSIFFEFPCFFYHQSSNNDRNTIWEVPRGPRSDPSASNLHKSPGHQLATIPRTPKRCKVQAIVQVTHFAAGAYSTTGGQDSCQRTVNSTAKTQHGLHTNLPTKNYRDCIYTLGAPLTWCLSTNQKPNLKHQGDGLGKISSNQPESYNDFIWTLRCLHQMPIGNLLK